MKRKSFYLSAIFALSTMSLAFGQTDIGDARNNYAVGATVTVTGVSADGGELRNNIRYIQDETGGIPVFGNMLVGTVDRGDSITVTGVLKDYNGLLEVDPITSWEHRGAGTMIEPWNINMGSVGETYEGRLIRIDNVTFADAGSTFSNGTNYTFGDGTTNAQLRTESGMQLNGVTIPSGAQTIFGLLSEFGGTYQVLPRDINDIIPYVAPAMKLEVSINGIPVLNGATVEIGNAATSPIVFSNIGLQDLTVSSISFTGDAAADFSTTVTAGIIEGEGTETGDLVFSTTENGSRFANIVIESNDEDNPVFTLAIAAIGADGFATEPADGATNMTFSNVKAYSMNVGSTPATIAQGYLAVWKKGSAPTGAPADGTVYQRGDVIGDGQVAYIGSSSSFKPRAIRANIDYHFAIYAYNGYGDYINYNQDDVLIGNGMSGGAEIGNYYEGISSADTELVDELTALINPHTVSSYFMYKGLMMDDFEVADTTGGDSYVVCCYSGERKVFSGSFDWNETGYSREHTYPHSWFPTHPANEVYGQEKIEYLDYHNLYPINQSKANEPRGNLPLGVVVEMQYEYMDGKRGKNANGMLVYEPRDENKGNAARCKFYMSTAYNGEFGTGDDWSLPTHQNQEILKEWHFSDLPDSYEIARHELIYSIQGNRNPYIDSVDFACYVDFHGMNYDAAGCGELGLTTEYINANLSVFPNPSNQVVFVQLNGVTINTVEVKDMTGRTVEVINPEMGEQFVRVNVDTYSAGTYLLNINTEKGSLVRKVIVQ